MPVKEINRKVGNPMDHVGTRLTAKTTSQLSKYNVVTKCKKVNKLN